MKPLRRDRGTLSRTRTVEALRLPSASFPVFCATVRSVRASRSTSAHRSATTSPTRNPVSSMTANGNHSHAVIQRRSRSRSEFLTYSERILQHSSSVAFFSRVAPERRHQMNDHSRNRPPSVSRLRVNFGSTSGMNSAGSSPYKYTGSASCPPER